MLLVKILVKHPLNLLIGIMGVFMYQAMLV